MKYEIIVFFFGGGHARLMQHGRTSWAKKTAHRHLQNAISENVKTELYKNFYMAPVNVFFGHKTVKMGTE